MSNANTLRSLVTELLVVFVGVALAFAVKNYRQDLNDRAVGDQYLIGFRRDLTADLAMLKAQQQARRTQLKDPEPYSSSSKAGPSIRNASLPRTGRRCTN